MALLLIQASLAFAPSGHPLRSLSAPVRAAVALQAGGDDEPQDLLGSLKSTLGIDDRKPGERPAKEGFEDLPIRMGCLLYTSPSPRDS